MDNNTFRDWIPEGEDTGAIGKDGFQDFVPAPEPKPQVIEETKQPEPVVKPETEPVIEQVPQEPIVPPLEPEGGSK